MPWYLYLAYKQLFPSGRFPFFTAMSMAGVMLGVAVLVVTMSVMEGFGHEIKKWTVDTQGDVQIRRDGLIADAEDVQVQLANVPGVVASTAFAESLVMVDFHGHNAFPAIQGLDLNRVKQVVPIENYLRYCSLDDLDDDSVILSSKLAVALGARIGDKVELYSKSLIEKIKPDEAVLPREMRVVGYFEIGHPGLDSSLVLTTLRAMQEMDGLGHGVSGINVKIAPGLDADDAAARINAALAPATGLHARSWIEINRDFLFIVQFEKNMMFFLLAFIVVVAAFSVASGLLIAVVRKTREIGLLGALGAKPRQVAACFCAQGFLIGVGGTAAGLLLGFGFLHIRNDVVHLFTKLTQSQAAMERFYQFSDLPAYSETSYMIAIVICSMVVSTLAGLIPAWRAARLKPVEALRSE
jgi:lipoprotein-releasing system permease protein